MSKVFTLANLATSKIHRLSPWVNIIEIMPKVTTISRGKAEGIKYTPSVILDRRLIKAYNHYMH